jgi:hypothetical protein
MAVSAWIKHCKTEEEVHNFKESLKRVKWVLDHIKTLVNTDGIEASEISPKSYDNPNWAYRQAHANGYKQAVKDFHKLLTLDQDENIGRQPITGRPVPNTN